jgi:hypothetical protein
MLRSIDESMYEHIKFICSYEYQPHFPSSEVSPSEFRNLEIDWIKVERDLTHPKDNYDYSKDGEQYPRFKPNLYYNELLNDVKGWVSFMDDDDVYTPYAIPNILGSLFDTSEIHLFRMNVNNIIIPRHGCDIVEGNVGTPNIVFHSSILNDGVYWDGYRCGDYRFYRRLVNNTNTEVIRHDVVTAKINK